MDPQNSARHSWTQCECECHLANGKELEENFKGRDNTIWFFSIKRLLVICHRLLLGPKDPKRNILAPTHLETVSLCSLPSLKLTK